ncbi:hypothetical protein COMA2_160018 [Candidatus Nitrospira nitrificans]|uniref:Uncharacterized protein n=1 Tax=Candidatus Nitrospira nitrificans TaxID=1742973 RepID=A0A0S4L903_9BACT|nr:hypothetical protein COMA2_160018 [Candidatus Nitrospira nitrificans]
MNNSSLDSSSRFLNAPKRRCKILPESTDLLRSSKNYGSVTSRNTAFPAERAVLSPSVCRGRRFKNVPRKVSFSGHCERGERYGFGLGRAGLSVFSGELSFSSQLGLLLKALFVEKTGRYSTGSIRSWCGSLRSSVKKAGERRDGT